MARRMQRLTDRNSGGGVITAVPQGRVWANNKQVAINGSTGSDHGTNKHNAGAWRTTNGSPNVYVQSTPVSREGDNDSCGHSRVNGSPNVYVN